MPAKDEKKMLDVTIVRQTQRVTTSDDGEIVKKRLKVGEEVSLPRSDARTLIACGKALEGNHGAEIKKGIAAAKKAAAA